MQDQTSGAGTHSESQRRRAWEHCRAALPCLHLPPRALRPLIYGDLLLFHTKVSHPALVKCLPG